MASTSTARLLSAEEIAMQAGQQVPFLRLPERATVFAEREMRLRQCAAGHPMGDFLRFMAEVARCQHKVLQSLPEVVVPGHDAVDTAMRLGMPPVPAAVWSRDAAWLGGMHGIVEAMVPRLAGGPAQATVESLRGADAEWLERQADRVLNGVMLGLDLAASPLIAAALQTYWTHLVLSTQNAFVSDRVAPFGRVGDATLCPCCGSLPTASVLRIGGEAAGFRYLHCSLCSAQWHMVRIKCSHCQKTQGIDYQSLQPVASSQAKRGAVEAETCGGCGRYLKIVHMERDVDVDPVADDLASVTLDLLVTDAGFERHGANPMLLFGDPGLSPHEDGGG